MNDLCMCTKNGVGFALLAGLTTTVALTSNVSGTGVNDPDFDDLTCATISPAMVTATMSFTDTGDYSANALDCNGNAITANRESGQITGSPILNCPWAGATGGVDSTYRFTPLSPGPGATTKDIDIILCGASFDTKIYVTDPSGASIFACNDDACDSTGGQGFASQLSVVPLTVGDTFHITVDAYNAGTTGGPYTIVVQETLGPCDVVCTDTEGEGFADCTNGVEPNDTFNGDCVLAQTNGIIKCLDTVCAEASRWTGLVSCTTFEDCDPDDPASCDTVTGFCVGEFLLRDLDFWFLTLNQDADITVTVIAEFTPILNILDNNDPAADPPGSAPYADCNDATLSGAIQGDGPCLSAGLTSLSPFPAGEYFLIVAPTFASAEQCGTQYELAVDCVAPCPWDISTDGTDNAQDGFVGTADLTYMLNNFGPCPTVTP